MKGRVSSSLWWAIGVNSFVLCVVLGLAYGAGARSSGLRLRDFTILPPIAGLELLGAAFLIVATSILLFVWLENRVSKPLGELVDCAERISAQDFEGRAEVGPDDFGILAESLNHASEQLARIAEVESSRIALEAEVSEVEAALAQLGRGEIGARLHTSAGALEPVSKSFNTAAELLARRIERVRVSVADLIGASMQSHSAAANCASSLLQTKDKAAAGVPAVDALALTSRQVALDAENAAEAARRALDYADQGSRAVRDASDGMQRIRAAMQATSGKIKALGDRSLEIYDIINLIHETNLLALNAVLEASRGGTSQAFDVLSVELRKLSDHSRAATRDIVSLLKAIQAESNEAVVVMEQANRVAEGGSRMTEHATKAFAGVATLLRQTAEVAQSISSAVREQANGIDEVKSSVSTIAESAHQNAGRGSDAARLAEQVTRLSEQLSQALAQFRSGPAMVKSELVSDTQPSKTVSAAAGD